MRLSIGQEEFQAAACELSLAARQAVVFRQEHAGEAGVRIALHAAHATLAAAVPNHVVRDALDILLEHAVLNSPPASTVVVTTRAEGREAIVSVRDRGRGRTEAELAHLFDLPADESAPEASDSLALRQMRLRVEQAGGHVRATSDPEGQGLTVELAWIRPLAKVAAA